MTVSERLFEMQDIKFRDFQAKLCPTVKTDTIIGVKTPALRTYAKDLLKSGETAEFLRKLPHSYFEENQLHAFIISEMKEYDTVLEEVESFLPYIDNWATCDQLNPKAFKKNPERLLPEISLWLASGRTYTIRFGIRMLMQNYLDKNFKPEYLERVSQVRSEEYYVNMMTAWYFATALAKQWDAAIPYLESQKLSLWVHNKTIQKAIESRRIKDSQKEYLRTLKQ